MKDLFGNEITESPPQPKGKINAIKRAINYRLGTKEEHCGNCVNHLKIDHHYRTYHKCKVIGVACSEATDIRLKNVCDKWEEK